jgi:glycosyltransferase involved in cell wall biosynthesis
LNPVRVAIVNSIRAYGGGEKWVLRAGAELGRRGFDVTVVGHPGGELETRCAAEGIVFSPVLLRHDLSLPAVWALRKALAACGAEVVVCCNQRAVRVGVLAAAGRPVVFRNGLEGSFKNKAHNRLLAGPRVARYVVNAEAVRQELLSFGWIPESRLRLIYNGVDPAPIDEADPAGVREELGAAAQDVVVLMAARMVPEKGHTSLVEAAAAISHARARFWLAGEGPAMEAVRARIEALGVGDRVRLLGFRADLPRLLRAADLLCHPSVREGAPNVVLEAMAAGLPVVGVDASGTAELVRHGETGLLAAPGDTAGLREHLEAVIGDEALRRRLGTAGRERARSEFSEERSFDQWAALLLEVAKVRR